MTKKLLITLLLTGLCTATVAQDRSPTEAGEDSAYEELGTLENLPIIPPELTTEPLSEVELAELADAASDLERQLQADYVDTICAIAEARPETLNTCIVGDWVSIGGGAIPWYNELARRGAAFGFSGGATGTLGNNVWFRFYDSAVFEVFDGGGSIKLSGVFAQTSGIVEQMHAPSQLVGTYCAPSDGALFLSAITGATSATVSARFRSEDGSQHGIESLVVPGEGGEPRQGEVDCNGDRMTLTLYGPPRANGMPFDFPDWTFELQRVFN